MADPTFTNAYFSNPFTIDNCVFLNFNGVTVLKVSWVITIDFLFSPRLPPAASGTTPPLTGSEAGYTRRNSG